MRPYDEESLLSFDEMVATIIPQLVRVTDLEFSQPGLSIERLMAAERGELPFGGDRFLHGVLFDGRLIAHDGNHRLAVARIRRPHSWLAVRVQEGKPRERD